MLPVCVWGEHPDGKDNFAADRAVGDQMIASLPAVQVGVRAQRDVLGRVVRFLVGEVGIRQLLDIGSGLPTAENVHEIAQQIEPATRVVYLDDNPVVLSHAAALLADDKATFVADGDLREPARILTDPVVLDHLDWDEPIGLLMCGILHYILDEESPAELVGTLYRALPRGSYVMIRHLLDMEDPAAATLQDQMRGGSGGRSSARTPRSWTFSTGLSWSSPAWCRYRSGVRIPAPRACVTILPCRWPAWAWPGSPSARWPSGRGGR